MSLIPNQLNNWRLYVEGSIYVGAADITLPNIVNQTDELRGGGLAGPINVPVIGHYEDLSLTITFFAFFPGITRFLEQTSLNIAAHGVVQYLDSTTAKFSKQPWSMTFTSFPKGMNPGRWSQGAKPDLSVERVVTALQLFNQDKRLVHLDKANMVSEINGVDYLEQDRGWL